MFNSFVVSWDDIDNNTTDINGITQADGLQVTVEKGQITVATGTTTTVRVVSAAGHSHVNTTLQAGESVTYTLPAGIYLVNNKKVIVY